MLWLAVVQSCHFGLPLGAFAASHSLDFPWYPRKGVTASPVKVLHQCSMQWDSIVGFTNLCAYSSVREMRVNLGQTDVKVQCWAKTKSSGSVNFAVPLPLGTKEWSTWWARTGGTYSTWSLCKPTSPTSSLIGASRCPGATLAAACGPEGLGPLPCSRWLLLPSKRLVIF